MAAPILFNSLRGYERSWLRPDAVAALTLWAVLVPEALAYASIAGVDPVVGLYAAAPALLLYAALGSSRVLVVGPMAATAALSGALVADLSASGADPMQLTAALALIAGVIAVVAGLARLGFLATFISQPVLKGFIIGLALSIIAGQLPELFGLEKSGGEFFEVLANVISSLGDAQLATTVLGVGSLLFVLGLRRFAPRVPGSLVAVVVGIVAVPLFGLEERGVAVVGSIPSGLPSLGLPNIGWSDTADLAAGAAGIVLVAFVEGLGAAKAYGNRDGGHLDPNRELLGLGVANVGAGLCSGMVVNGSLSKSAVNAGAGAKSQVSGLIVAGLTVLTLLVLTGLFETLPMATLAAVVVAAVIELVDVRGLVELSRAYSTRLGRIYGPAARRSDRRGRRTARGAGAGHPAGPLPGDRLLAGAADLPGVEAERRGARPPA